MYAKFLCLCHSSFITLITCKNAMSSFIASFCGSEAIFLSVFLSEWFPLAEIDNRLLRFNVLTWVIIILAVLLLLAW